jgi:hypothetical protein
MSFIERIESLSSRFLSDRSYELIVAPAIADLQHDAGSGHALSQARSRASVLVAFAGAAYEDLTADSSVLRIAALALIPASYYTFLIFVCAPQAADYFAKNFGRLAIPAAIVVLSFGPVLACCWPERTPSRPMHPDAADA